ncbi:MAG: CHAD domain-containing protein [Desulfobacterales bacterium]
MNIPIIYNLPEGHDYKQFIVELSNAYAIKTERSMLKRMAIYDTFDWRLFDESLVLTLTGKTLLLRKLFKTDNILSAEISRPPVFLKDFPSGELKKLLTPIIKMRALFKLVEVYSCTKYLRILNPDEKTVAVLVYKVIRSTREKESPALAAYLRLHPVKGYSKYSLKLSKHLKEAGFSAHEKEDIYFKLLASVNKIPGSYSSKLNLELDPEMRSDEATKIILRSLLKVIKTNEAHIEKDLDTEFLHDYRVAVRRTRSALGQIKNVFPKETASRFKKDFSFLGKLSNQLRDLDVYLLKKDSFKAMIPSILRDDIDPLFDYLRNKRSKALKQVIRSFRSNKYRRILQGWEKFLKEPQKDAPTTSNADLSILTLAQKRIYKQYGSIVNASNRILENIDDEKLHSLRIECKKLRYLMEFFSCLFPYKKMNVLIAQQKKLQNKLGDFNDLCVQQEYLLNISEELSATTKKNKRVLVSIGCLIGSLDREMRVVKKSMFKTFTNFVSPTNERLFRELFAS